MQNKHLVERSYRSFTRLARFFNQLMRQQLFCGPVTVQQCYTLEALMDGPKTMNALAAEVALHQSTLTRVVEKLEKQNFAIRTRKADNQRTVEVRITEDGQANLPIIEKAKLANDFRPAGLNSERPPGIRWLNPWKNWPICLTPKMKHSKNFLKVVGVGVWRK